VQMHDSGTSAVATFLDERVREQRVALVAHRGGGARTTTVASRYEDAVRRLGFLLWPASEWRERKSCIYKVGARA
jgi:pimeloyl-ACP methyl ester carboxylesterase